MEKVWHCFCPPQFLREKKCNAYYKTNAKDHSYKLKTILLVATNLTPILMSMTAGSLNSLSRSVISTYTEWEKDNRHHYTAGQTGLSLVCTL